MSGKFWGSSVTRQKYSQNDWLFRSC